MEGWDIGLATNGESYLTAYFCHSRNPLHPRQDADGIDPVTATDKNNELLVTRALKRQFPLHVIIGGNFGQGKG